MKIALVGIGGYGGHYVKPLLGAEAERRNARLVAAVDPDAGNSRYFSRLRDAGVPIYSDLEGFLSGGDPRFGPAGGARSAPSNAAGRPKTPIPPDLVILATPIHLHCRQACLALSRGSNVLCEKPLCATIQEARLMIEARDRSGKFLAVGYQWSFSRAIQDLKRDIAKGVFGKPKRLKSLALRPRGHAYYKRNAWAGARLTEGGQWALDSPVNNAAAHFLHNMFYVLGPRPSLSARPLRVQAELYRANRIDNYDTAALRCLAATSWKDPAAPRVEILFYASHATREKRPPEFHFEFEKAAVHYGEEDGEIVARLRDGSTRSYGSPEANDREKLWKCIEAVREEKPSVCGPTAASAQTLCMNGAQESMPEIVDFPRSTIAKRGWFSKRATYVRGLDRALRDCYDRALLPSENPELRWARKGTEIDLETYDHYPGKT